MAVGDEGGGVRACARRARADSRMAGRAREEAIVRIDSHPLPAVEAAESSRGESLPFSPPFQPRIPKSRKRAIARTSTSVEEFHSPHKQTAAKAFNTQRRRPRKQAKTSPSGDEDDDDDDDMPVSQLRLRHLLLRSPSRSKKQCKAARATKVRPELQASPQHPDSDDEVPLFLLKVKSKPASSGGRQATVGAHAPKKAPLTLRASSADCSSPASPDGSARLERAAANTSPSGRPLRTSRSPVNYDEQNLAELATASRPVYLDWRGEAGQDPRESGRKYAIRKGSSPKGSKCQQTRLSLVLRSEHEHPARAEVCTEKHEAGSKGPEAQAEPSAASLPEAPDASKTSDPEHAAAPTQEAQLEKVDADQRPVYECEAVLGKRKGALGGLEYLVRW
eukprot:COSAG03_NODE_4850_length_1413_cov_1.976408_1_plen_391_part_10